MTPLIWYMRCVQVLGLDFLVDCSLHPWLLEVNGTPSLAVDHADPDVEQLICEQKVGGVMGFVMFFFGGGL
jgi:hypothetical protein